MWLDLAKDYQQQAILAALEELIRQGSTALILPRTVVDEFARNKARVIEESSRSLSSTLKRVKEAVEKFGDPRKKNAVLRQLNDVDHRLPTLGEAAADIFVGQRTVSGDGNSEKCGLGDRDNSNPWRES